MTKATANTGHNTTETAQGMRERNHQYHDNGGHDEGAGITQFQTMAGVLEMLWERTANHLTPKELEWLAGCAELPDIYLHQLEEMMDGVGLLVSNDGGSKLSAGSFQESQGASSMLFFFAEAVRMARTMAMISRVARIKQPRHGLDGATPKTIS